MLFKSQLDSYHRIASTATGLTDFGGADYIEGMTRMLADLDEHSHFNVEGANLVSQEIVGRLCGRLIATRGFNSHPDIDGARITRPIFIVGMARSGTTALLRLLSADPSLQGLELWLGSAPMPRPPRAKWESIPAYQQAKAGLEELFRVHPQIRIVHPMSADKPVECRSALDHTFWSPGSMNTSCLPEYGHWVLAANATYAYRYHRRVLALVGGGSDQRWVLKDPSHLFGVDALLEIYPDACIVQTHRDLLGAVGSTASGCWGLRHAREPELTQVELGRQMSEIWTAGLEKMETIRQKSDPKQFFDLHIDELQADPAGAVNRIFQYFDLPVTEDASRAWRRHSDTDPRAGHGKHGFSAGDYGLSDAALRALAPQYSKRLDQLTTHTREH